MEQKKRKYRRYPCLGVSEIKANQGNIITTVITGLMYNISQSGMKCSANKELQKGTSVAIQILEFMGEKVSAGMRGTIVWSAKTGTMFNIGIRFDEELVHDRYPELCELICKAKEAT